MRWTNRRNAIKLSRALLILAVLCEIDASCDTTEDCRQLCGLHGVCLQANIVGGQSCCVERLLDEGVDLTGVAVLCETGMIRYVA